MSDWQKLTKGDWWPTNRDEIVVAHTGEGTFPEDTAFAIYGWRLPEVAIGRALLSLDEIRSIGPVYFSGGRCLFSLIELRSPLLPDLSIKTCDGGSIVSSSQTILVSLGPGFLVQKLGGYEYFLPHDNPHPGGPEYYPKR